MREFSEKPFWYILQQNCTNLFLFIMRKCRLKTIDKVDYFLKNIYEVHITCMNIILKKYF